jgi:hypothetical protein
MGIASDGFWSARSLVLWGWYKRDPEHGWLAWRSEKGGMGLLLHFSCLHHCVSVALNLTSAFGVWMHSSRHVSTGIQFNFQRFQMRLVRSIMITRLGQ